MFRKVKVSMVLVIEQILQSLTSECCADNGDFDDEDDDDNLEYGFDHNAFYVHICRS